MLSYAISSVQTYFHLPVDDEDVDTAAAGPLSRPVSSPNIFQSWTAHLPRRPLRLFASLSPSTSFSSSPAPPASTLSPLASPSSSSRPSSPPPLSPPPTPPPPSSPNSTKPPQPPRDTAVINQVLAEPDLYRVLGVSKTHRPTKSALRRAYLNRSRACHPDKFRNDPEATRAFQKLSLAYEILSTPSSRRLYDSHPSSSPFSPHGRPTTSTTATSQARAEETFRNVLLGLLNEFLDGDLEMVRSLLTVVSDTNPSLKLGEDAIDGIFRTVQAIRDRGITCRTCILALHAELTRLLELQQEWAQIPYLDVRSRSRITLQLARVTLNLPVAVEQALVQEGDRFSSSNDEDDAWERGAQSMLVPPRVATLIRALSVVLEKMENLL